MADEGISKAKWQRDFLASGDAHLFSTLREPLNEDQGEFDTQVLALTKLLIDPLMRITW